MAFVWKLVILSTRLLETIHRFVAEGEIYTHLLILYLLASNDFLELVDVNELFTGAQYV